MKYVVAKNFQAFRYFLDNFTLEDRAKYRFVANDNWRGIDPQTIFILLNDYQENEEWKMGQLPIFLSRCYHVYYVQEAEYIDYRSLVKDSAK